MIKKISMGVVTSVILVSTLAISGCGSADSSNDTKTNDNKNFASVGINPGDFSSSTSFSSSSFGVNSSSGQSSSQTTSMSSSQSTSSSATTSSSSSDANDEPATAASAVRVSDAYVIGAVVKMGGVPADIEVDGTPGMYEWTTAVGGTFTVGIRAVNDINGNGIADDGDAYAPALKAIAGYENINPFTTLRANGVGLGEMETNYPIATAFNATYNFDVVAEGKKNLELAKEVLTAALILATQQKEQEDALKQAPNFRVCEYPFLPNTGPNGEDGLDSITHEPCFVDPSTVSSSSDSSDSSSSSSSVSTEGFANDITLATSYAALQLVAKKHFDLILGVYPPVN